MNILNTNSTLEVTPHKLIIAEKPSVARDIAAVIGARERCKLGEKSVYYKGSGFMVDRKSVV